MDEFNFKPAQYCINKIFDLTKSCVWAILTGCNKVVIEPRVVQFWSEIKLVISNRTSAARLFDFEIHAYDLSPNCTPPSSITITNET